MTELQALLDRAYGKCIPDGECMIWRGAVHSQCKSPSIRIGGRGHGVSLRRLMLQTVAGRKLDHRMMATYTCGNSLCVRLEHMAGVSRRVIQLRIKANANAADKIKKSTKIIAKARARSKLTMDIANEIRGLDLPQREIARRYGITQSTVGSIKRGKAWIDQTNPFLRLAA